MANTEVLVTIEGELKRVIDDIVEKKTSCDHGAEELSRRSAAYNKTLWETIKQHHPITKDAVCNYNNKTGEVHLLYRKPQ
jgi:hypothetical protein